MRTSIELRSVIDHLRCCAGFGGSTAGSRDPRPVRWDRWLELVDEHQLGPFLGARIPGISERAIGMPSAVLRALRSRTVRSGLDAAFRSVELFRLFAILEQELSPIALKGAALAHMLYAESAEREMSDFDLLFSTAEETRVAEIMLAREGFLVGGTGVPPNSPRGHHHRPPVTNGVSELTIELHTNLTTPPLPRTAIQEMFRMRRRIELPDAGSLTVLDPISAVLHHALHAVADPIDSPLLRNLFEVAWLVQGLSRIERSTVRTLARRWGVEDRVASALILAHELFGSPRVVEKRALGARELWCLKRLEWTRTLEPARWKARVLRDLARRHMRALARGADGRNPWPLIAGAFGIAESAIRSRLSARFSRRPKALEPATLYLAPVGECLVAHDARTGYVHLLDRLSAEVFQVTKTEKSAEKIETLLKERGIEEETTRLALDQLVDLGLLRAHHSGRSATRRGRRARDESRWLAS